MLNRILVPTDFTETSDRALRYALELARPFQASIVLLHAIEPIEGADEDWTEELYSSLREQAVRQLDERLEGVDGDRGEHRVVVQPRWRAILDLADSEGCDLIVMGSRSPVEQRELVLGSTSFRTFLASPVPLLVVRERS